MSKMKKIALVLTALIGLPALALAAPGEGKRGEKDCATMKAERAEHHAERQERRKEMVAKFDANKDGQLDDAERATMRRERVQKRFQMMDANGDGSITLGEMEAFSAKKGGRFEHGGFGGKHRRGGRGMGDQ